MDSKMITQHLIYANRNFFNNYFAAISLFQERSERTANMMFDQAAWIPVEGKRAVNDWMAIWKKGAETFRVAVNEGFQRMETLIDEP
ncbi:MAG: hypothetical protein AB1659_03450 [Thermodesulfobacteriota bacterium]